MFACFLQSACYLSADDSDGIETWHSDQIVNVDANRALGFALSSGLDSEVG